MKNIFMFLMVLSLGVATSCDPKNEDPAPDTGLKLDDLVGNWNFESVDYNGKTWVQCGWSTDATANWNIYSGWNTLNLIVGIGINKSSMINNCNSDNYKFQFELTSDDKYIEVWFTNGVYKMDLAYKFEIVFLDLESPTKVAKIKMLSGTNNLMPVGAVYTIVK